MRGDWDQEGVEGASGGLRTQNMRGLSLREAWGVPGARKRVGQDLGGSSSGTFIQRQARTLIQGMVGVPVRMETTWEGDKGLTPRKECAGRGRGGGRQATGEV